MQNRSPKSKFNLLMKRRRIKIESHFFQIFVDIFSCLQSFGLSDKKGSEETNTHKKNESAKLCKISFSKTFQFYSPQIYCQLRRKRSNQMLKTKVMDMLLKITTLLEQTIFRLSS